MTLRSKGFEVREAPGTVRVYHDVYCPHGHCVDVININDEPIYRQHLVLWVKEDAAGVRENVCPYH